MKANKDFKWVIKGVAKDFKKGEDFPECEDLQRAIDWGYVGKPVVETPQVEKKAK